MAGGAREGTYKFYLKAPRILQAAFGENCVRSGGPD